jgi:hypothetical protein
MRMLIADLVRRGYRWPSALFTFSVAIFWASHRADVGEAQAAFAMSLGAAFMMGPLFVAMSPAPRAIWYLPVSRRDVWRATWLVASVGPVVLTTAGKLVARLVPAPAGLLGFSSLTLSSAYDFAYAGIGCGLIALCARSHPASGPRRHLSGIISTMSLVAAVGGLFWGFAIRHWLPTHWSDLSPVTGTILAAALALALAAYFYTPGLEWRTGRPFYTRTTGAARPRQTRDARFSRRAGPTGLPRLLLHEYAFSVALGGFLVVAFGAIVFVTGALMNSPGAYGGFLRMQNLLLFDETVAPQRRQLFDLLIWFGLFAGTLVSRFPETIRHLRVLPIRASALNLLLVAWPLVMLVTVWAALLGLHYAVLGQPVASLQPALFVALAGSSAIMRALSLRWPGYSPFIFSLSISVVPMVRLINGPSSGLLAVLGIGGLAAAAALNHFTLMRSATYRRPPLVLGRVQAQRWA